MFSGKLVDQFHKTCVVVAVVEIKVSNTFNELI